jgi:hypothetical protein
MQSTRHAKFLIFFFLMLANTAFSQDVYKWQDGQGRWHISNAPSPNRPKSAFAITLDRVTFTPGFARIEGIAENQSNIALPSPKLTAKAIDVNDGTLYAEFFSWPAGRAGARIEPRQAATFSVNLQMPNRSMGREVRFDLNSEDLLAEVNWTTAQQRRVW